MAHNHTATVSEDLGQYLRAAACENCPKEFNTHAHTSGFWDNNKFEPVVTVLNPELTPKVTPKLTGRNIVSAYQLAVSLRAAAEAHHIFEQGLGHPDANWSDWYAQYIFNLLPESVSNV